MDSQNVDFHLGEEGFESDEAEGYVDEGDESDPLASDSERLPRTASEYTGNAIDVNDCDNDYSADDALFGPSIDDLVTEKSRGRRRRRGRRGLGAGRARSRSYDIPHHLKPKMGSANMAFISKDYDLAERLLSEIIEEAPRAAAALRTLGLIYEAHGKQDPALDCFMKAAQLERFDGELWKRNASIWKEKGHTVNAILCLSQALQGPNSGDREALHARAQLYLQVKRPLMAADSYVKLAKFEPFNVENARFIVKAYIDANNLRRAVEAIDSIVLECERQVAACSKNSLEREAIVVSLLELLTELKMRQQRFVDANLLLVRLRGRSTAAHLPLTFKHRVMIAICQHRLGSDVLAAPVFQEFMSSFAEMDKHRFLLWQIADACHDSGHYHMAADAYTSLIDMKDEEPRVDKYLRRALCYKELNRRESAKADLEMVLSIQPRHIVASLHIQEFLTKSNEKRKLKRFGKMSLNARVPNQEIEEAMEVLKKANSMFDRGDFEGYLLHIYAALDTALELRAPWRAGAVLRRVGAQIRIDDCSDEENEEALNGDHPKADGVFSTRRRLKKWTRVRSSPLNKQTLLRVGTSLMRLMEHEMFVEVAERILLSFRAVGELEMAHPITRIFNSLSHLRVFGDDGLRHKLWNLDLVTSIADGAIWRGYDLARLVLQESPTDVDTLYALTLIEQLCEAESDASDLRNRSYRGLARLRKRHTSACLSFVLANVSSRGGLNVQRYTVGFYLAALVLIPEHALISLCLAIQVLYVAMGRRIVNRNETLPHALTYLQTYHRSRRKGSTGDSKVHMEIETDYNLARALHQIGLVDVACNLYERVIKNKEADVLEELIDLRREAAYNLMQIYRNSGNPEMGAKLCNEILVF